MNIIYKKYFFNEPKVGKTLRGEWDIPTRLNSPKDLCYLPTCDWL